MVRIKCLYKWLLCWQCWGHVLLVAMYENAIVNRLGNGELCQGIITKKRIVIWTMFRHEAIHINLSFTRSRKSKDAETVQAEIQLINKIVYWYMYTLNISWMLTDWDEYASIATCENALLWLKFMFRWKGIARSIYEIGTFYGFRLFQ